MNRLRTVLVVLSLCVGVWANDAHADLEFDWDEQNGSLIADESSAWNLIENRQYIDARELGEKLVKGDANSFVGHFVLGHAHHYGEANFPKALLHTRKAMELYETEYGNVPNPRLPWRWHVKILLELVDTYGDLDQYDKQLEIMERHNASYSPPLRAEKAWPLMKLRRYAEARLAANEGLASGDVFQRDRALNALCAIEFEAGNDTKSYDACKAALIQARIGGHPTTVDLSNHAEAARSLFRFDETERLLIEATTAHRSWFGNPWLDLADLYMRGARFAEALAALRELPSHRAKRPPHLRQFDLNEARRALASFYLLIGRPEEAMQITDKALVMPDRRSHNSRDPAQDRSLVALVDRRARLIQADNLLESSVALPWYKRAWEWARAQQLRLQAWRSGRMAARLLADERRLVGTFMVGTARSAIMPPWLLGELVDVLGQGVVVAAVQKARATDSRKEADAYYDALLAEVALKSGNESKAIELANKARASLKSGDALLKVGMSAVIAEAKRRNGAWPTYEIVLARDPGVLRRMEFELPVRIESQGAFSRSIAKAIARSPRFDSDEATHLRVTIQASGSDSKICLLDSNGQSFGCGNTKRNADESKDQFAQRSVDDFHRAVFEPRVDLSQADIHSLDGSNRSVRNPLETLFD